MRGLSLTILLVGPWMALADDSSPALEALKAVPDLRPQLTAAEVETVFRDRPSRVDKLRSSWPEGLASLQIAHDELAPSFEGATKIILYSLYPMKDRNVAPDSPRHFHDYPVYGNVEIDDSVERWTGFLQGQVVPAKYFLCDFSPRHGFRFVTPRGEIDVLVCFQCSGIKVIGTPKIKSKLNVWWHPHFSRAVEKVVNTVFQKNKIEQDPNYHPAHP